MVKKEARCTDLVMTKLLSSKRERNFFLIQPSNFWVILLWKFVSQPKFSN